MIKCKVKSRGNKWKDYTIERIEDEFPMVRLNGTENMALLRVESMTNRFDLNLSLSEPAAVRRARKAMVVPRISRSLEIRLDSKQAVEDIEAMMQLRQAQSPVAERRKEASLSPIKQDEKERLERLEARFDKLRVDDARRRLDDLKGIQPTPQLDTLKERFAALRGGDTSGPAFKTYSYADFGPDDEEDDILAWAAREQGPRNDPDLDNIIDELATEDLSQQLDIELSEPAKESIDTKNLIDQAMRLRNEASTALQDATTTDSAVEKKSSDPQSHQQQKPKQKSSFKNLFARHQPLSAQEHDTNHNSGAHTSDSSSSTFSNSSCDDSDDDDRYRRRQPRRHLRR